MSRSLLAPPFVLALVLAACGGAPVVSIAPPPPAAEDARVAPTAPLPVRARTDDPANGAIDGSVAEWGEPSLVLGGERGVRIWLAITKQHVRIAARSDAGAIGDVSLHVAAPVPAVPPIGFVNQFGLQTVAAADECDGREQLDGTPDASGCKEWFEKAQEFRRDLPGRFRREIVVGSRGLVVRRADAPAAQPVRIAFARGADGKTLEAELPLSALPPIGAYPFRGGRVVVEVQAGSRVFASAPPHRAADERTYGELELDRPLAFGPRPDLLELAFTDSQADAEDVVGCFVVPSPDVTQATCLANVAMGYQFEPSEPSPKEVEIDVGKAVEIATRGDASLWLSPSRANVGFGEVRRFVRFAGGRATWKSEPHAGEVLAQGPDGEGIRLLFADEGTASPLGTGMCGACPRIDVWWARFDGSLASLGEGTLETFESQSGAGLSLLDKKLDRFVVLLEEGDTQPEARCAYTWSAKDAAYVLEAQPEPKKGSKKGAKGKGNKDAKGSK